MSKVLGKQELALLAYVQMRNLQKIRSDDLRRSLNLSAAQTQNLLSRMQRRKLIAQVRKGLYLVPQKLPLGGVWSPDDATAIQALMDDKNASYQITGPNAFNRYGYDEQIPAGYYIYNNSISGKRKIGQIDLTLIKVLPERLGDIESVTTHSGEILIYSSRVRTLVDAVYDWSRFDSLPRAYDWIRNDILNDRIKPLSLVKTAIKYGNTGTIRRMGVLLELLESNESLLKRLEKELAPTNAKIPFIPTRPLRGRLIKRWGVIVNE